jgi:hypothetical protein
MVMSNKFTIKALMLGIITSFICTFFDGMFIIFYRPYVPYSYPFILLIFNTVFWSIAGGIETFCYSLFVKKKKSRKNEALYGVFFYLIPFAVLYGGLSRLPVPQATFVDLSDQSLNTVFDYHLSFVLVALIILFLIYFFKKNGTRELRSPLLFSIEIITFIVLFQFCSNFHIYLKVLSHLKSYINIDSTFFIISVYILGVVFIFGFYKKRC